MLREIPYFRPLLQPPGGSRWEEQISRILLVRLSRQSDDTVTRKNLVQNYYMAHLLGSSVLIIFAENSVRLSTGDLTTGLTFWHCAHSMWSRVYKTVRCPSVSLSHQSNAAAVCSGFAAERRTCKRYRQRRAPGSSSAAARSSAANAATNVMLTAE